MAQVRVLCDQDSLALTTQSVYVHGDVPPSMIDSRPPPAAIAAHRVVMPGPGAVMRHPCPPQLSSEHNNFQRVH